MEMAARQVAEILDVSVQRVSALSRRGDLPYQATPLGRLYRLDEVMRLAAERRERAKCDARLHPPRTPPGLVTSSESPSAP